jgi:hypothetical protein
MKTGHQTITAAATLLGLPLLVAPLASAAAPAGFAAIGPAPTSPAIPGDAAGFCRSAGPEIVPMRPTQNAPGGRAEMMLSQPPAPFGISVDAEGRQLYRIDVRVSQLRRFDERHYIVWAATPELDQHVKLGPLDADGRVESSVFWNKFLVFVTEEADDAVERWEGPVLLRGISPSARMHTMAGHGPFEDVNCQQIF